MTQDNDAKMLASILFGAARGLEKVLGEKAVVTILARRTDIPDKPLFVGSDDPDEVIKAINQWKQCLVDRAKESA